MALIKQLMASRRTKETALGGETTVKERQQIQAGREGQVPRAARPVSWLWPD